MITDRTQTDVDNVSLPSSTESKGAYNCSDLNRVEAKVKLLNELLVKYSYMQPLVTKLDWTYKNKFNYSDSQRYLGNIQAIRQALATYSTTPPTPVTMANLTYQTANDIEQILVDVEQLLNNMQNYFVYSGVAKAGQGRMWQNRFRKMKPVGDYLNTTFTPFPLTNAWSYVSGTGGGTQTGVHAQFTYTDGNNDVWTVENLTTMKTSRQSCNAFVNTNVYTNGTDAQGITALKLYAPHNYKPETIVVNCQRTTHIRILGGKSDGTTDVLFCGYVEFTSSYANKTLNIETNNFYNSFVLYFENTAVSFPTAPYIRYIQFTKGYKE